MNNAPQANPAARPSLAAVLTDVLADLAFMVSDDQPAAPAVEAAGLSGEIRYRGPVRGTLQCWCPRALAVQLAANLLGIETEEDCAQLAAEDALREFLNVVCGQLVTAFYGTVPVFALDLPVVRVCDRIPEPPAADPSAACLWLSGQPLICLHRQDS
jgi:CheY-specific phosphatase CheX